jgi:hypothetical protein
VLPAFDVFKSARPMSRVLLSKMAPGEPYGIYPRLDSTFLFYTGRFAVPLESEEALHAFAARPGRVWLLAQRDDLARLRRPPDLVGRPRPRRTRRLHPAGASRSLSRRWR